MEQDINLFEGSINEFLDAMPKRCRINYPELIEAVAENLKLWAVTKSQISLHCHRIVPLRDDLLVVRGRGIVKIKWT